MHFYVSAGSAERADQVPTITYEMEIAGAQVLVDDAEIAPFFARALARRVFAAMEDQAAKSLAARDGSQTRSPESQGQ